MNQAVQCVYFSKTHFAKKPQNLKMSKIPKYQNSWGLRSGVHQSLTVLSDYYQIRP